MRRVLGKIPSVPDGAALERTPGDIDGAKAPNPTHVNASSPMGHAINPQNRNGGMSNVWYTDMPNTTDIAIDKD